QVNRQVGKVWGFQIYWIAYICCTWRNRRRSDAVELQDPIRLRHNGCLFIAQRDLGSADDQRRCAESVAYRNAQLRTADADMNDLTQRLIVEVKHRLRRRRNRLAIWQGLRVGLAGASGFRIRSYALRRLSWWRRIDTQSHCRRPCCDPAS